MWTHHRTQPIYSYGKDATNHLKKKLRHTVPSRNAGEEELLESKMHPFQRKQVKELQVVTALQSPNLDRTRLIINFYLARAKSHAEEQRSNEVIDHHCQNIVSKPVR